jgi:alpha-beta hydrolase superfamily lysophospholipase
MIREKIFLTTEDKVKIAANFYPCEKESSIAVVCLHMMPATKESWDSFAIHLQRCGLCSLAIDERGHGESTIQQIKTQKRVLDYRDFSDTEHQKKFLILKPVLVF